MQLLSERTGLPWLPPGGTVRLFHTETLPDLRLTSSAFVLCFRGTDLLFAEDRDSARGWDIPGGHREGQETLEQTARRELREEGGVDAGELTPIAHVEVEVPSPAPEGYQYPVPKSYMAFFIGRVSKTHAFVGEFETKERRFFPPDEARQLEWVKRHPELYETALGIIRALDGER